MEVLILYGDGIWSLIDLESTKRISIFINNNYGINGK